MLDCNGKTHCVLFQCEGWELLHGSELVFGTACFEELGSGLRDASEMMLVL